MAQMARIQRLEQELGEPLAMLPFHTLFLDLAKVETRVITIDEGTKRQVATINYGFEPAKPPFEDVPQVFLDPLTPQEALALYQRRQACKRST